MKTVYIKRLDLFRPFQMLLCNNITEIDESFIDDNFELFYHDCDECNGSGEKDNKPCEECGGEGRYDSEVYQYYLTSLNDYEKEQLDSYKVPHGYSDLLELDVLPIYDFGTSWSAFSYSKEVDDNYELQPYESFTRLTSY